MFEYDYCLCGNSEHCPKKETCKRAIPRNKPGIYTMALFYEEGKECEEYWEKEQNND